VSSLPQVSARLCRNESHERLRCTASLFASGMTTTATMSRTGLCRTCLARAAGVSRQLLPRPPPPPHQRRAPPSRTRFSVVTIRSGSGGNGCVSFDMSRGKPGIGLPTGGNGGRGRDIASTSSLTEQVITAAPQRSSSQTEVQMEKEAAFMAKWEEMLLYRSRLAL
jgi:hypothetical protein